MTNIFVDKNAEKELRDFREEVQQKENTENANERFRTCSKEA